MESRISEIQIEQTELIKMVFGEIYQLPGE